MDKEEKWKRNKIQKLFLYSTYATLSISPDTTVCFHPQPFLKDRHLCFIDQLDEFNFKQLKVGTVLGKINDSKQMLLIDKNGRNIFNQFFSIIENNLTVKSPLIPCMLTKDAQIAKSDCLGYIMKKTSIDFKL